LLKSFVGKVQLFINIYTKKKQKLKP